MIKVTTRGSFRNAEQFFSRVKNRQQFARLERYGPLGVRALASATPVDSSDTANSWYYEIIKRPGYFSIQWLNSNMEDGVSIAAIIQYGHATGNGGRVQGVDYVNPAMRPIFEQIATDMWKEVTK